MVHDKLNMLHHGLVKPFAELVMYSNGPDYAVIPPMFFLNHIAYMHSLTHTLTHSPAVLL